MDWRLPGIDGIETSRRIKASKSLSSIPAILMISAFDRDDVMSQLNGLELEGFLISPVGESTMMDTIGNVFGTKPGGNAVRLQSMRSDGARLTGRRVLLVDDNEFNCDIAGEVLTELGISFRIAVNGREAVDLVAAQPFDLVLMDIQMPVMDGLAATRLIRTDSRFRNLPILAMTAHAMSGDREKSLDAGLNDHITKPISFDGLTKSLLAWMPAGPARPFERETPSPLPLPAQEGIPDQLPPFDIRAALLRNHGKPKLIRKLLVAFHDRYANAIFELKRYLNEGKTEEAQQLVHSLKSLAAALEATELTQAALAVEMALRSRQPKDLSTHIDMMAQALAPAIAAASSVVAQHAEPSAVERARSIGTPIGVAAEPSRR
jgi:CheY-like chemotaxis protein